MQNFALRRKVRCQPVSVVSESLFAGTATWKHATSVVWGFTIKKVIPIKKTGGWQNVSRF